MKHLTYTILLLILSSLYALSVTVPIRIDSEEELALLETEGTDESSCKIESEEFDHFFQYQLAFFPNQFKKVYINSGHTLLFRNHKEQPETPPPNQ